MYTVSIVYAQHTIFYTERRSIMLLIQNGQIEISISQNNPADFATIESALNELTEFDSTQKNLLPAVLKIKKGIYRERLTISRPHLTLMGDGADETILTYDLYARMPCEDVGKLGTFRSYSCMIDTHDFTAKNLTFQNRAGKGPDVGQALALYADGDRLMFENCRFLGGQDTLFTAPLPPVEIEPNGFIGPKQHAPRLSGRHYYKNCYIEGDIDFIFGGATAYFEGCEFFSKDIGRDVNSFVTAASTPKGQAYGYVMDNCRFTGNCPPHSAYLGRPWREYAQVVLLNCHIGEHICEEGWHDWNKPEAQKTVLFAEYCSKGPSAHMKKRPDWVRELTPAEAACYSRNQVLSGADSWNP